MAGYAFNYSWIVNPHGNYPDTGGTVEMKDGQIASTNSAIYCGWNGFGATVRDLVKIDLGAQLKVGTLILHYADSENASGVVRPAAVEVMTSVDDVTYELAASHVPNTSDPEDGPVPWVASGNSKTRGAVLNVGNATCRYLKVRVGAGGIWMMLSEVEVLEPLGRLAGTAVLDTGAPASYVLVRDWSSHAHLAKVFPQSNGQWELLLRAPSCEVTVVGPEGYQPITHGPVVPAEDV